MVAGAPPAARRIQILPMNQLVTFGMKGSNSLVDHLMVLFHGKQCGSCVRVFYDLSPAGRKDAYTDTQTDERVYEVCH
jgi:hypothetical protein